MIRESDKFRLTVPTGDALEHFKAHLAMQGCRVSLQRASVVQMVLLIPGNFKIGDVLQLAEKHRGRASRPTIFRAVEQMIEAGLLTRLPIPDDRWIDR